jgi:hypothetical protein
MHGLPHHTDQDIPLAAALDHLVALSNSARSIVAEVGCLTIEGPLLHTTSMDLVPDDPASGEHPVHFFRLGTHGGLVIREAEFQGAHLWTADGDDYFSLTLKLAVPLTLSDRH